MGETVGGNGASDNPAGVDVEVDAERHVWTLDEWPITQLSFEASGIRLVTSKLAGSAEIRIAGRFTLERPESPLTLDAADTGSLAPVLPLLGAPLRRIEVGVDGHLALSLGDGAVVVRPDARFRAWEAQGSGVLDGLGYGCPPGGGMPW